MRFGAPARSLAAGLAVSVCALLLGLTLARHAVPGDTFQVARATHASVAAGADVRPDTAAVTATEGIAEPSFAFTESTPVAGIARAGWAAQTRGCRGPPAC
ncbi:hypothetical protein [Dactylosporangium sp. CA-233914]|uniref:hypothetical protein n=1 Tax=Dactylosporangium sp. CA-233914 TaxID=3239934 RepID=UPI003D8B4AB2